MSIITPATSLHRRDFSSRLRADALTLGYDGKIISKNLSVSIPDGEFTVIVGPNACG